MAKFKASAHKAARKITLVIILLPFGIIKKRVFFFQRGEIKQNKNAMAFSQEMRLTLRNIDPVTQKSVGSFLFPQRKA